MQTTLGSYPTNASLKERYLEIERSAIAGINDGKVVGNPIFSNPLSDTRYSLCAQGLIHGTPAHPVLLSSIERLAGVEPSLKFQPAEFLHFTLAEVAYNNQGREAAGINAQKALRYHQAIKDHLVSFEEPLNLRLFRIFPTLDPSSNETHTASLVSAFLSDDERIFRLREEIKHAVEKTALSFSARLGMIKVLFITLGRFEKPPTFNYGGYPFLSKLQEINDHLSTTITAPIDAIQLISTATSYPYSHGHVFIEPPIPLQRSLRTDTAVNMLRPWQKAEILRNSG